MNLRRGAPTHMGLVGVLNILMKKKHPTEHLQ